MIARLLAHLAWADERTHEALRAAGPAHVDALALYAHLLGAEHIWLARLRREPARQPVWPALTLEACAALARENHAGYAELLAGLGPAELEAEVPYTNSAGASFRSRVADIIVHVALHGCYHRGQVAQLLRRVGAVPQPTDYIAFVRGAPAATRKRNT